MALPRPLHHIAAHARWLYPLVVVVLASILGHFLGLGLGLLIVGGGVLGASIWLIWSSLQGLGGNVPLTLEEALSLGAPSAEEEQKRSVLRALKDLEYERAVGKINEEDYAALAQHYRSEAKRLLRAVDKDLGPERERAERILAERMARGSAASAKRDEAAAAAVVAGDNAVPNVAVPNTEADWDSDTANDDVSEPAPLKSPTSNTAQ